METICRSTYPTDGHPFTYNDPVLRSKFRLSSDLECIVTYWWDSQTTTRSCKTDKRIRLAYSS